MQSFFFEWLEYISQIEWNHYTLFIPQHMLSFLAMKEAETWDWIICLISVTNWICEWSLHSQKFSNVNLNLWSEKMHHLMMLQILVRTIKWQMIKTLYKTAKLGIKCDVNSYYNGYFIALRSFALLIHREEFPCKSIIFRV